MPRWTASRQGSDAIHDSGGPKGAFGWNPGSVAAEGSVNGAGPFGPTGALETLAAGTMERTSTGLTFKIQNNFSNSSRRPQPPFQWDHHSVLELSGIGLRHEELGPASWRMSASGYRVNARSASSGRAGPANPRSSSCGWIHGAYIRRDGAKRREAGGLEPAGVADRGHLYAAPAVFIRC